jgi:DNA-binding CsgD family transcriptional regulator
MMPVGAAPLAQDAQLVGRDAELLRARRALTEQRGVLFSGPSGTGRTALLRRVAGQLAAEDDFELLELETAASDPPIPFSAFAPVAPVVGAKGARRSDPLYLLQTFRAAVLGRAGDRRLVMAIDDAHLLDTHSAALVHQLVSSGEASLLATVEAFSTAPEGIHSLWLEELVDRIDLAPLDHGSTLDMISGWLGRADARVNDAHPAIGGAVVGARPPVAVDLAETVWWLSGGNPMYVRELLAAGFGAGSIVLRDGVWNLDGRLAIGGRLVELIHARIDRLRPAERKAMQLVAFAEPIPLTVLLKLTSVDSVSALEDRGLVSVDSTPSGQLARVTQPLFGEAIRPGIPASRRTALARKLADAYEKEGGDSTDLVRVTGWRLDCGDPLEPERLVRASFQAGAAQDWAAVTRLAEAALAAGAGGSARLALANAYRAEGRFELALDTLGDDGGDEELIARTAVLESWIHFFGFGQQTQAAEILTLALTRISDPSERTWLEAVRTGLAGFAGRPVETAETAAALLDRPGLAPRVELTVRFVLSMGLSWTGRPLEALSVTEGPWSGIEELAVLANWSVISRAIAFRVAGRVGELEELSRSRYEKALAVGDRFIQGSAASGLGWAAFERGNLARAISLFREAADCLRSTDSLPVRGESLSGLAEALALTGDAAGAEAVLEEARGAAERSGSLLPSWSTAAAWVAAAQGLISEALDRLSATASLARLGGQTAWELRALHAAVRLGSTGPADRISELAEWMEGTLVEVAAAHARALRLGDRGGDPLDAVVEMYAGAGLDLYAAEAAAQASRAHQAAGAPRRAAASAARAHLLLASSEDGTLPLPLALALTPPELTRREREVAMLAGRGLSSSAIAGRLCLSVRTVDTHLARVYVKLGISSRSGLAAALTAPSTGQDSEAG